MDCNSPSVKTNKARIFISYSHRGNGPKWKAALVNALQVFERHHLLDVWEDGKIRVSSFWDDDIKQAMSNARLAVVLLTKEALESEYILNTEFPFLRERQQRDKLPVYPVVCEACNWKDYDWLRATQAPNESNPLSQLSEAAQNRVFRKLATDIAGELSHATLAELPKPDHLLSTDHVYLDKFPLTHGGGQSEKLIGREQELALLDLAFAQPQTAIISLIAWGGVGKTMLVQHWLQRLQREGWFSARRVYAWSFYSQGTKEDRQVSEDAFLAHALAWFGVQCEPTLSPWNKGKILADAVVRERTLLILDGIEPLQYPPGPMGGRLRIPGVQGLLKQLARKTNSEKSETQNTKHEPDSGLCLVTTREPLTDLADFERRPDVAWGSVLRVDLVNLTEEAGAALLHYAGAKRAGAAEIEADDTELIAASREVDGHALTLNLLGRFLARSHGGDIRRRNLVKFEEADRREQGGTTFKMLAAFENWFANEGDVEARALTILRLLGLFDRPADAGCMSALRKPPAIAGLTEPLFTVKRDLNTRQITEQPLSDKAWNDATHFLSDFGLIVIQTDADKREQLLDCHPLIREHFASQLCSQKLTSWRYSHDRLFEHLKNSVPEYPNSLDNLLPLYQSVLHGCAAGRGQEACEQVFFKRIRRQNRGYSWRNYGTIGSDYSALATFFTCSPEQFVDVQNLFAEGIRKQWQEWLFNEIAFMLRMLGRIHEALVYLSTSCADFSAGWGLEEAVRAANLAELFAISGSLDHASSHGELALDLAEASRNWFEMMDDLTIFADIQNKRGHSQISSKLFQMAEETLIANQRRYPQLYSFPGARLCDFLMTRAEVVAWKHFVLTNSPFHSDFAVADDVVSECRDVEERAEQSLVLLQTLQPDVTRAKDISLPGTYETPQLTKSLPPEGYDMGFDKRQIAFDRLAMGRVGLLWLILGIKGRPEAEIAEYAQFNINAAVAKLQQANASELLPTALLTRAWLRFLRENTVGASVDLDEAWDIAERGPMRLHMADIHLYRARLFFREKPYPWKSPQDDLAAAEKLINECDYHRRDEELADAKHAILGE